MHLSGVCGLRCHSGKTSITVLSLIILNVSSNLNEKVLYLITEEWKSFSVFVLQCRDFHLAQGMPQDIFRIRISKTERF